MQKIAIVYIGCISYYRFIVTDFKKKKNLLKVTMKYSVSERAITAS